MPDWYPLVKAAKTFGVAPWELLKQPVIWQEIAAQYNFALGAGWR